MDRRSIQSEKVDNRWGQLYRLLSEHPDEAPSEFWDDLYRALKDLVNGQTEQVCMNRENNRGPIRVQWTPVTVGEKQSRPGAGPG